MLGVRTAKDTERLSACSEDSVSGDEWVRTEKTSFWETAINLLHEHSSARDVGQPPGCSQARAPSSPDPLPRPAFHPSAVPPNSLSLVVTQSPHLVPVFALAVFVGLEPGVSVLPRAQLQGLAIAFS